MPCLRNESGQQSLPNVKIGLNALKEDEINGADFHFSVYHDNPSWVEQCKINHILLNAWTVNEAEEMDWMINNHFDFITTNEPELLFEKCKIISNK